MMSFPASDTLKCKILQYEFAYDIQKLPYHKTIWQIVPWKILEKFAPENL